MVRLVAVGLPILELAGLILAGSLIGFWATLGLLALAALAGGLLLRGQGRAALAQLRAGRADPGAALLRGGVAVVAGLLLIFPGFLGDVAAILLLLPPVQRAALRAVAGRRARGAARAAPSAGGPRPSAARGPVVEEAEWEELPPPAAKPPPAPDPAAPPRRPSGWTRS